MSDQPAAPNAVPNRRTIHLARVLSILALLAALALLGAYGLSRVRFDGGTASTGGAGDRLRVTPTASAENPVCARPSPYPMREEFARALSLATQRFEQSRFPEDRARATELRLIRNCVEITYDAAMTDRIGAHGVFSFDQTSSQERLQIAVSPTYALSDDLLTAMLLVHELNHAVYHANGLDALVSCFQNEAEAFRAAADFVTSLTPEEKASLEARANADPTGRAAQELSVLTELRRAPGATPQERALAFVRSQPGHQQQCGRDASPRHP
ncbi:MAG: hypothetical protein M3R02_03545 [Chloroflexota bacterium]|nr:hypothetical protein [Chloroflexota bacterium]